MNCIWEHIADWFYLHNMFGVNLSQKYKQDNQGIAEHKIYFKDLQKFLNLQGRL
jgi:hypothetical protein